MRRFLLTWIAIASLAVSVQAAGLDQEFATPPDSARPWVYWFWLNSNITKEGITADLEAMRRVGIGGVLIMEVDQGAPVGPVAFGGPQWRELFGHVCTEAARLGLEVNMNNDAGWCGSGGPWVTPDRSMQKVVWTETAVEGPRRAEIALPEPAKTAGYYRDIAVVAFPTPAGTAKIQDLAGKTLQVRKDLPIAPASYAALPADQVVSAGSVVQLTAQFRDGRLAWDAPAGRWTVLRLGHTSTGAVNAPAPLSGRGLECDKLSKEAVDAMFAGLMGKLIDDNRPLAGKSLVRTHIDSWEVHSQNWTPRMREEFRARRGYDLDRFLPVLAGYVVDSLEVSERFLWDFRQTISDLLLENYADRFRELARRGGLELSIEAYGDGPLDDLRFAGRCDEPMGEFWSWEYGSAAETCTEMVSAAHTYGRRIIGAEAMTATDAEKWLGHPGNLKALGDWAFCEGINRFVFHRYALQPWTAPGRSPGMSMGPWGLHYERTQTWWEYSKPWHEYLSRCQHLLRQGHFVADLCYVAGEGAPRSFHPPVRRSGTPPDRPGYNFDACSPEVVLTRMSVVDGRIVLPDGMSYRLLVLPDGRTMTPALLAKIVELVEAGATVVGPRPDKAPGLENHPAADDQVKRLAERLWGPCDGKKVTSHQLGKGRVVWGITPQEALAGMKVPPDFACDRLAKERFRYIHRRLDDGTELYFVANGRNRAIRAACSFRAAGKRPELWRPETGRKEPVVACQEKQGVVEMPLELAAAESVFVVFRPSPQAPDAVTSLTHNGQPLVPVAPPAPRRINVPGGKRYVVQKAAYGVLRLDVTAQVQAIVDAGRKTFRVAEMAAGDDPAPGVVKLLELDGKIGDQPYHASGKDPETIRLPEAKAPAELRIQKATYGLASKTLDVAARIQAILDRGETDFQVARMAEGGDPAPYVVKTLTVEYTIDGKPRHATGRDPETIDLEVEEPLHQSAAAASLKLASDGHPVVEAWANGRYELKNASGKTLSASAVSIPSPQEIAGPWEVNFAAGTGAPKKVALESLVSWSSHADPGVKYFSGTAAYTKTFSLPARGIAPQRACYLDLGQVAVMARTKLNGQDLGILWKSPYRVEITQAVRPGENVLEIEVTNLWINRMIGDEQLAEDSRRNPNGTLASWPGWLEEGKPSPTGRHTFTSWRLWKKDAPLAPSGLLGPVVLHWSDRLRPE